MKPTTLRGTVLSVLVIWTTSVAGQETYQQRNERLNKTKNIGGLYVSESPVEMEVGDLWQTGPYCGVNALFAWLNVNGTPVDYQAVRSRTAVTKRGSSLLELTRVAKTFGFGNLASYQISPKQIQQIRTPFIALMKEPSSFQKDNHYIMVASVDEDRIRAIDGTSAFYDSYSMDAFLDRFTGFVLADQPPDESIVSLSESKGDWLRNYLIGNFLTTIILSISLGVVTRSPRTKVG